MILENYFINMLGMIAMNERAILITSISRYTTEMTYQLFFEFSSIQKSILREVPHFTLTVTTPYMDEENGSWLKIAMEYFR